VGSGAHGWGGGCWRKGKAPTGGTRLAVREKREGGGCRLGLGPREGREGAGRGELG